MKTQMFKDKLFLIEWGAFLLCIMVCVTIYTLNKIKNETAYNKAIIEQMGKPQILEQRYYSPLDCE